METSIIRVIVSYYQWWTQCFGLLDRR